MQCPVDQTVLQMTDRQGVEIDYCPQCRGVWLDRGELDKIIEKSEAALPPARPAPAPSPGPDPRTEVAGYPQQPPYAQPGYAQPGYAQPGYSQYPRHPGSPDSPDDYRGGYDQRHGRQRRKKSMLGELFDF